MWVKWITGEGATGEDTTGEGALWVGQNPGNTKGMQSGVSMPNQSIVITMKANCSV